MRIVAITGAPGVGKTEVGRRLVSLYPPGSAVLDTDALAGVHPFRIDDRFHAIIADNLQSCLSNFLQHETPTVVVTGVLHTAGMLAALQSVRLSSRCDWAFYALTASTEEITRRISNDSKSQDPVGRLSWLHLNQPESIPQHFYRINTTHLSLDEVVAQVGEAESLATPASHLGPSADASQLVCHPKVDVVRKCVQILSRLGASKHIAQRVVEVLVENECTGHRSHGLLQLPSYVEAVRFGALDPSARPSARRMGPLAYLIEGKRSFGVQTADCITRTMTRLLVGAPVGVVGVRNSGHLGRLASLVRPLCDRGWIMMGFVNYLGLGKRVAPWGGAEERFSTNPIVFGLPGRAGPIVLDMSTSVVAEGVVRTAALDGRRVPEGILVDRKYRWTTNPNLLYDDPPGAMLAPIGGPAGYKGFGLGLVAEFLAGIVTGAGSVARPAQLAGNGGLFIGVHSDILGQSFDAVIDGLEELAAYVEACSPAPGFPPIRMPGRGQASSAVHLAEPNLLMNARVWQTLCTLEEGGMSSLVPTPVGSITPTPLRRES